MANNPRTNAAAFVTAAQTCVQLATASLGQLHLHFDGEPAGAPLDLAALIASADAQTHLYCCGPGSMLNAFERACEGLPAARVHREHFSAAPVPVAQAPTKTFELVLARQGITLQVSPEKSILQTVLDAGVDVPYSCFEGVCGACETRVLEGDVEHGAPGFDSKAVRGQWVKRSAISARSSSLAKVEH